MKRFIYLSMAIVLLIGLLPAASVANGETDPPDTTIDTGPDDPTNSTSATFTFHGDDGSGSGVASYECQLDDGGFEPCASPKDYTALLDGYHKFEVRAVDANGNVDPYPADYYWFVDTVPPDTTIDTGSCPANPIQFNGVTFTFSGSDPGYSDAPQTGSGWSDCDCSLDGAAFEPCEYNSQQTYLNLEDGSHTFEVRAIDWAGNADQSPDSCTWVVDTVAPVTTIDSGPDNPSNSDSATFEFSGDDGTGSGVDHFVCWHWPEGFDDPCSSSKSYSGLSDGEDTFEVYAVDKAGNPEDPPAKYTWVVDTTPPETTIDDSPSDPSDSTSATFKFSSDDGSGSGVAHFECQLDDEPPEACDSGEKTYTGLGLGSHTFSVYATDALGNADQTPATYTWEIAIQGPGISLVKKTDVNGEFFDNNDAPGRALWVLPGGGSVSWRYEVKNTGTTVLTDVTVTDDKVPAANINCYSSNVSNVIGDMDPGASVTCEGWDSAVAGEYANTGTVTGTPPEGEGDDVTASDPEYYFGADPQLAVAVVTADGATAGDDLTILLGEPIVLRYTVTNPGNVPISDVTVSNNPSSITPVYKSGDTSNIGKLDPNETWIYEASNTATANWPGVTGSVDGSYTDGYDQTTSPGTVHAEDSSKCSSADPQIEIVKTTVGSDGTEGDGVTVNAGGPVTWKYYVTNTGNVTLSNVTVTDDKVAASSIHCDGGSNVVSSLPVGYLLTCTATGTNNLSGGAQYNNTGAAEGSYTDSAGHTRTARDSDASSYTSSGTAAALSQLTPSSATCKQFKAGTAADLSQLVYTVNRYGMVSGVTPSTFSYFTKVTAPSAGAFNVLIAQNNDRAFPAMTPATCMVTLYDANCNVLPYRAATVRIESGRNVRISFAAGTSGRTIYAVVRYATSAVYWKKVSRPYPTVNYTFSAAYGASSPFSQDSLALKPQ